ncbi:hypothetical protein V9T40_000796 [Parthenolecanium corni]|uniref:Uncharacterized protein n=1 Tax=Parthenolecanium corni TaxID=536013 RepID=A0AAN9Y0S7_9HEMI
MGTLIYSVDKENLERARNLAESCEFIAIHGAPEAHPSPETSSGQNEALHDKFGDEQNIISGANFTIFAPNPTAIPQRTRMSRGYQNIYQTELRRRCPP